MKNPASSGNISSFNSAFVGFNPRSNVQPRIRSVSVVSLEAAKADSPKKKKKVQEKLSSGEDDSTQVKCEDETSVKTFLIDRFNVQLLTRICITEKGERKTATDLEYEVHNIIYSIELYSTSIVSIAYMANSQYGKPYNFPIQKGLNVEVFNTYYRDLLRRLSDSRATSTMAYSHPNVDLRNCYLSSLQTLLPLRLMSLKPPTIELLSEGAELCLTFLGRPILSIQEDLSRDNGVISYRNALFNKYFVKTYNSMFNLLLDSKSRPSSGTLTNYRLYMRYLKYAIDNLPGEQASKNPQGTLP